MDKKPIVVLWQSLVVPHYRSFWIELSKLIPNQILLLAPDKFKELGQQMIDCAPFSSKEKNVRLTALRALTAHTQAVYFVGLYRQLRDSFSKESGGRFIVMAEPYSITAFLAWLVLKISGRKNVLFYTYALQNIVKDFSFPMSWIQKFMFAKCDAILSLGREQDEVLREQGYKGRCIPFYLWFDSQNFNIVDRAEAWRELAGKLDQSTQEKIRLGYVGSLLPEKGLDDLFAALENVVHLKSRVSLEIVGRGPEQKKIEDSAELLRSQGWHVSYIGPLPQTQLKYFYNCIDILIVPSQTASHWKEQFGRVIVEAEGCGCLCIGSNSGAIPEVIGDSQRIFHEKDPKDLSIVLERICAKVEGAQKNELRQQTRDQVVKRFSDEYLAQTFSKNLACD